MNRTSPREEGGVMRVLGLACALGVVVSATSTYANEVIHFVNGSRMEVEHYEIRGGVVVITTVEGKLRSFPRSYINFDLRQQPRHAIEPQPAALPDERRDKARRALELFGANRLLLQLRQQLFRDLAAVGGATPRQAYALVDTERVFEVAAGLFADQVEDRYLEAWLDWLDSPLGLRILEMERSCWTEEAAEERAVFAKRLKQQPADGYRVELMERLDKVVGATETSLEMYLAMAKAIEETFGRSVTDPPTSEVEAFRERYISRVREATRTGMLLTYQSTCDDDLWGYLTYWETGMGRRLTKLARAALLAGVRSAGQSAKRASAE
jgi:hypothetical protein